MQSRRYSVRSSLLRPFAGVMLLGAIFATAADAGTVDPAGSDVEQPSPVTALLERFDVGMRVMSENIDRWAVDRREKIAAATQRKRRVADAARRRAALARQRKLEAARATHRCPVDAPRWWYPNDFGVMSTKGEPHRHQGVDLFAPIGAPIRAPFDGWLELGSNNWGGLTAKLYGGGGFTYNAHMSGYGSARGRVRYGDIIGYVGNSGIARGTASHNHFEWHPGAGPAVSPYSLLYRFC